MRSPRGKSAGNSTPQKGTRSRVKKTDPSILLLCDLDDDERQEMLSVLIKKDRKLKSIIEAVGGFNFAIEETDSPFESIAESIIYQQLTGKAAATIFTRLKNLFDSQLCPSPEEIIAAPDTVLRTAGLSRSKIVALKDLSEKTLAGVIPTIEQVTTMSDEQIIESLTAVKGVGVWTAQMFLIFRLGRADVMPSGDYGVRKGFSLVYDEGETLPSPSSLEEHAERWKPFRTVGSWFMWRAVELHRRKLAEQKGKVFTPAPGKSARASARAKAKVQRR